ncbi:hypothetical protein Tco_1101965, partial [Tanacetum coccineum]
SGGGPRRQETIGDTIAQTGFKNVSKTSNDSLLVGVNTPRSDEDRLNLNKLMAFFKKLEKKEGLRTHKLKRLYKVGLYRRVESFEDKDMFRAHDLVYDEVVVETEVTSKDVNLSVDEVTLAQALAALKSAKPKLTRLCYKNQSMDKGKGIMVEEPLKMKKKDQVSFDEQEAIRLQDEFDEEERLTREKDEANQRRKNFAAKRAEEKRNRPPTKAQQRSTMCTYLKNMVGYKHNQLKNKSFDDIQKLFDKAMKRVNTFVDMDTELVEGSEVRAEGSETKAEIAHESSSKRARESLEQESSKKQKLEEDKESEELKQCLEIIPNDGDDVTIDATPLSTKSPTIVDYKIYK